MSLLSGYLVDRYELKNSLMLAIFFICLSQILMILSTALELYWLLISARFVFGLGFPVIALLQSIVVKSWFIHSEMSFANNICDAISRCVIGLSGLISPRLTEVYGISDTLALSFSLVLISAYFTLRFLTFQEKLD